jgi:ketosteroid isomerase-like protein
MRSDTEGVLEAALHAYALDDLPAAAAFFAEDAVYAIYVDEEIFPFGGEVVGRASILSVWQKLRQQFDLVAHTPLNITGENDIARCQVAFQFRHRQSGETIDGILRLVVQIEKGRIVRLREYHDQERLRAFIRLVASPLEPKAVE